MIKYLLIALITSPLLAKNYLVEIADFNCKYCLEAEHYTHKLKYEAKGNGDEFIFAPVLLSQGNKIEELFYYAVKDDPKLEKFARKAMFDVKQKLRLKISSLPELLDFLKINYAKSNVDFNKIETLLKENSKSFKNVKAYLKALKLVEHYEVDSTPTFLLINDKAEVMPIRKPEAMTTPQYINHVLDMYKRISNS